MKKIICLCLVLFSLCVVVSCDKSNKKEIAIIQYVTADALDNARKGIVEGLADKGFVDGENINITIYNPQADANTLAQMAETAVRKSDMIFAIATPVAIVVKNECEKQGSDVPVLFTAVTDPLDANLVESNEVPGKNVTGTNDMNPVALQVQLLKELNPDAKKLGIIFTASERNSEVQVNLAKAEAAKLGITVVTQALTSSNEIQTMTQALLNDGVDAIYLPTDNIIAASITAVTAETNDKHVPTICGEEGMMSGGGTITLGINYTRLGQITGEMGAEVLNGADISKMAVKGLETFTLVINKKAATASQITIPETLIAKADRVVE